MINSGAPETRQAAIRSRALESHAKARLGIEYHETTADGEVSLEPIYCLGNCACSPAIMIDECVHSRVTPALFDELMAESPGKAQA